MTFLIGIFLQRIFKGLVIILAFTMIFLGNPNQSLANSEVSIGKNEVEVVELLCLKVPMENKDAWLEAEKTSWGPWLNRQQGFLGRQLLWNPNSEEAILLINWSSREQWKAIPKKEVDAVQGLFEIKARAATGQQSGNPFPLQYQGELLPQ